MQEEQKQPLILTLKLDAESQAFFDAQRKRYFPPERNFLKAHLTLFHQLPDEPETYKILEDLKFEPFEMQVVGLINLGACLAYKIESKPLKNLHGVLSNAFKDVLIVQDNQGFRPHITIQNKVMPEVARKLLEQLSRDFEEFKITAVGLELWLYLGGPWEWVKTFG